jgi:hypothetical protein
MSTINDYTHKNKSILDIRLKTGKKNDKFFSILIDGINSTLHVSYDIFNERIKSFFLGKSVEEISREDILKLKWNFIITQGYFYKITDRAFMKQTSQNESKYFVSILEIVGNPNWEDDLSSFEKSFGRNITIV